MKKVTQEEIEQAREVLEQAKEQEAEILSRASNEAYDEIMANLHNIEQSYKVKIADYNIKILDTIAKIHHVEDLQEKIKYVDKQVLYKEFENILNDNLQIDVLETIINDNIKKANDEKTITT